MTSPEDFTLGQRRWTANPNIPIQRFGAVGFLPPSGRGGCQVATNRDTMSDFDDGFYSEMLPNRQRKGSPPGY